MKKIASTLILIFSLCITFSACEEDVYGFNPPLTHLYITPRIIIKDKNRKEIDVKDKIKMTLSSRDSYGDYYAIDSKHSASYQTGEGESREEMSLQYRTSNNSKYKKLFNYGFLMIHGGYIGMAKDYQTGDTGVATFELSIPDLWGEGKTHTLAFHWRIKIKENSSLEAEEFKITKIVVNGVEQAVIDMDGYHWCIIDSFD